MAAIAENPRSSSVEPPPEANGRIGFDHTDSANGLVKQNGHFPKKSRRIGKNELIFAEDDPVARRHSLDLWHTREKPLGLHPTRISGSEAAATTTKISGILYELEHRNGTMPKSERERKIATTVELSRGLSPDAFPIEPSYSVRAHRGKFVGLNSY